jgi:dihydrofolate reductase
MRKVIYSLTLSLDGFVETVDGKLDWSAPDPELHTFINEQQREVGAYVYGRRLYELMAGFWPTADQDPDAPPYVVDFARIWRDTPKVVFSTTLRHVDWNSTLVRGGDDEAFAAQVAELRARPGGPLAVGGPGLAATFVRLGLVDEYRLYLHPTILGGGKPFFPALDAPIDLRLVQARTFGSGVQYLRYQRADRG